MSSQESPRLHEVDVQAIDAARLEPLIGIERMAQFEQTAEVAREALAGSSVLNVNSTGAGGGVAEMLQTLLAYARGAGIDARWLVIEGDPEFFAITKRIHNGLYGAAGDGGELGAAERRHYERIGEQNAHELLALVRPGDVVVAHDPQPAALVAAAKSAGARVVWRCHVGLDRPNEWSERSWEFLRPYLAEADAIVVSRAAFAPPWADPDENAAIVNALQRHASVIVQKSLAEGFGLTVTEAMWKRKPVVASAVGGIVDQIENGVHGLLVADPADLAAFGAAVESLLRDREDAAQLAQNGRRRVTEEFLGDRHLERYASLFEQLPRRTL